MKAKLQRIILAWTKDDVVAWRAGDFLIPLTAEAYVAASALDEGAILDAGDCLGQSQGVDETATRLLNALHEELQTAEHPWFEAYANVVFGTKTFQLVAWLALIRALRVRFTPLRIEVSAPEVFGDRAWSADMFIYSLARESFYLAQRVLEREGVAFTQSAPMPPLRPLRNRRGVRHAVAQLTAAMLGVTSNPLSQSDHSLEELFSKVGGIDILLVGQQFGDAFHAAPLAERLLPKYGQRFLWLGMRPQALPNMTSEEISLISQLNLEELRFIDSASFLKASESPRRSMARDLGSAWQIAGSRTLRSALQLTRRDWVDLLDDAHLEGIAARYQIWEQVLERLNPKVIVGLSALQDMGLVRAWARRRKVPFVCFMHGAFYALKYSHDADADYLGVFGRMLADQLPASGLPQPKRVAVCGAMQFGDKAAASGQADIATPRQPYNKNVLFLGFFDSLPFCPWSPGDMWRMLRDVHSICHEFGKVLRVRPHPRFPVSFWSPFVDELERGRPGSICLSTEPSLLRDLTGSDFVVATGFDGAVLDALFVRKCVLAYLPSDLKVIDHSRPLAKLGSVANSLPMLRELVSRVVKDESWKNGLCEAQAEFLRYYVDNPEEDPWDRAVELVDEAFRSSEKSRIRDRVFA